MPTNYPSRRGHVRDLGHLSVTGISNVFVSSFLAGRRVDLRFIWCAPLFLVFIDLAGHRLGLLFSWCPILDGLCCHFSCSNAIVTITEFYFFCFRPMPVQLVVLAPLFFFFWAAMLPLWTPRCSCQCRLMFLSLCQHDLSASWFIRPKTVLKFQDFIQPPFKSQWHIY